MGKQHLYTNRLIHEKSPYLLQHAHNPVDWYPWGEEAFRKARELDKPILLSIGYATCHWCHVMEHESFQNVEVAKMMNDTFVNIKIDREELPEVDNLYMEFAQSMMAGAAGWPLNIILTPELMPFFAATYLPSKSSHGLMGLFDLIKRIQEIWSSDERLNIIDQAEKIVSVFSDAIHAKGSQLSPPSIVDSAADLLYKMTDPLYGGMKGPPKFPIGYQISFLLRYYILDKDTRALFVAEKTLDMMHRGGIYDHLGGGFSRYSIDEQWLVPHFEKMLYDNAILVQSYLEAWQLTKKPLYQQVAKEILDYLLRDMTHPNGGFFSAEDADSEGHEGRFYTWPYDEIIQILGPEESAHFCNFYGVTPEGNFENRNILHTSLNIDEFCAEYQLDPQQLSKELETQRKKLWRVREKRIHPLKDDKILTSWNGLLIYSLAEAGCAFEEKKYLEAAISAARFIKENLWKEGTLLRRWREGEALHTGNLDDYAFTIRGVLAIFEANGEMEWLEWAIELAYILQRKYKEEEGAFYQTDGSDPNLILRKCQFSDGAEPSGNAIHCENLLRLYQITGRETFLSQAEDILKAIKENLENYPPGYSYHLMDLHRYYSNSPTFVVSLDKNKSDEKEIKRSIFQEFIPYKAVIWHSVDENLEELIPFIRSIHQEPEQTSLSICYKNFCKLPVTGLKEIRSAIQKIYH